MAVTEDQYTEFRNADMVGEGTLAAATTLYDLTLCFWNAAGYLASVTASGLNKFAGVVKGKVDNSGGAAGAESAEFYKRGVFKLTGSGFAITDVGKAVYATDNFTITEDPEAGVYIGTIARFVSATQVEVQLDVVDQEVALAPDPGDTGSIGATANSFHCTLASAGAETRTLADPLKAGLRCSIDFATDGGTITVTAATALNDTGNNTITFDDVGGSFHAVSVVDGAGGFKWQALTVDAGAALSTV